MLMLVAGILRDFLRNTMYNGISEPDSNGESSSAGTEIEKVKSLCAHFAQTLNCLNLLKNLDLKLTSTNQALPFSAQIC